MSNGGCRCQSGGSILEVHTLLMLTTPRIRVSGGIQKRGLRFIGQISRVRTFLISISHYPLLVVFRLLNLLFTEVLQTLGLPGFDIETFFMKLLEQGSLIGTC